MSDAARYIGGYDPGGDGKHGVAKLRLLSGRPTQIETATLATAEAVIEHFTSVPNLSSIGIDTLTCWSTGPGAWRPADRFLRDKYATVASSVVSPNGLFGSMGLNGPAVLLACQAANRALVITETHPKVLYWHLAGKRYDFAANRTEMEALLARMFGVPVVADTHHAWDAALSALAAYRGTSGDWTLDLHQLACESNERLLWPCGSTHYFWPRVDR
jgi:hypothetical protein